MLLATASCSNGNRSWQSIKGVQHGTVATRELLLLTPVLLPGPGGAASRDKREFRLWALPFPVPPCSRPVTAPGCARHDSGFYDVGTRQQATNLSQTKQPLDEDGCHYKSSAMLDAQIQWFLQPCHSPEQPVHVLPSSLCYKGNNAYVIKLCYYENKTN